MLEQLITATSSGAIAQKATSRPFAPKREKVVIEGVTVNDLTPPGKETMLAVRPVRGGFVANGVRITNKNLTTQSSEFEILLWQEDKLLQVARRGDRGFLFTIRTRAKTSGVWLLKADELAIDSPALKNYRKNFEKILTDNIDEKYRKLILSLLDDLLSTSERQASAFDKVQFFFCQRGGKVQPEIATTYRTQGEDTRWAQPKDQRIAAEAAHTAIPGSTEENADHVVPEPSDVMVAPPNKRPVQTPIPEERRMEAAEDDAEYPPTEAATRGVEKTGARMEDERPATPVKIADYDSSEDATDCESDTSYTALPEVLAQLQEEARLAQMEKLRRKP